MKCISTAWVDQDEVYFELENCLTIHAQSNVYDNENPFEIYFLWGFKRLSDEYVEYLRSRHIHLHDCESLFRTVIQEDDRLVQNLNLMGWNNYEKACYLRWLIVRRLELKSFCHIDLDLFFTCPWKSTSEKLHGLNGTFGSPCLTVYSSDSKFAKFTAVIREFAEHPHEFSLKYTKRSAFRFEIGSDQDLFQAISDGSAEFPEIGANVLGSDSIFINPLFLPVLEEGREDVRVDKDTLLVNGKLPLFWHLQRNFVNYYADNMFLENFKNSWEGKYLPVKRGLPFIQINPTAETFAFHSLRNLSLTVERGLIEKNKISFNDLPNHVGFGVSKYYFRYYVANDLVLKKNTNSVFLRSSWHQ